MSKRVVPSFYYVQLRLGTFSSNRFVVGSNLANSTPIKLIYIINNLIICKLIKIYLLVHCSGHLFII